MELGWSRGRAAGGVGLSRAEQSRYPPHRTHSFIPIVTRSHSHQSTRSSERSRSQFLHETNHINKDPGRGLQFTFQLMEHFLSS